MRGKFGEGEEKPDGDLREKLHAMESKVRKMREVRNNFNDTIGSDHAPHLKINKENNLKK